MNHFQFQRWRKAKGFTQQQAADWLYRSIATIRAYEAAPERNQKARKVPREVPELIRLKDFAERFAELPTDMLTTPGLPELPPEWQSWLTSKQREMSWSLHPALPPPGPPPKKRGRPRKT